MVTRAKQIRRTNLRGFLRDTQEVLSGTQLFRSQEIWGFDAYVLSYRDKKGIPTGWHEYMLAHALRHYVSFGITVLGWQPPLMAEIGLVNVAGYSLFMDNTRFWDSHWGPISNFKRCSAKEAANM